MKNSRTRYARTKVDEPLSSDELVAREAARVPESPGRKTVREPLERPLIISSYKTSSGPRFRESRSIPGAYVADSEAQWVVGALGRSAVRLPLSAAPRRTATSTPAMRPRGIDASYLPRIVPRKMQPLMRSFKGHLIKPENVYGTEDRITFWPSGYPWHCNGKLFSWSDPSSRFSLSSGSAVLVGPRHVLTAGHMVPWLSDHWMMLFSAGHFDGVSVPKLESYVSDVRGWNPGGEVGGRDVALLRLYDPIGEQLGWFGSKMYDSRWEGQAFWNLIGYPLLVGGAERPTWQGLFPVLRSDAEKNGLEIMHRGDSSEGNSGGPLYAFWPDGFPYVIGTHSGTDITENKDFNAAAGGQAMIDLIRWGLANWK
jgi:hypothetical protein